MGAQAPTPTWCEVRMDPCPLVEGGSSDTSCTWPALDPMATRRFSHLTIHSRASRAVSDRAHLLCCGGLTPTLQLDKNDRLKKKQLNRSD